MGKQFFLVITLLFITSLGLLTPAPAFAAGSFVMTSQPSAQTIAPGMSVAYGITVTSTGGFNSPVTLNLASAPSLPTDGSISVSFIPSNTVNPSASSTGFAILVVQTTASAPVNTYQLTISGTGGGMYASTTVVFIVTSTTSFSVLVTPLSQIIGLGNSQVYQITVSSFGSFSDQVALSVISPPSGISYQITPSTVTPTAGNIATAGLTVSVSPALAPGSYALAVRGSLPNCVTGGYYYNYQYYYGGYPTDCAEYSYLVVQVPSVTNFQMSVSPLTQTVTIGQNAVFAVQAASVGGFSSNVQLSLQRVPTGVTFAFNPVTLSPTSNNLVTSTLTISPSTVALPGSYNVDVIAVSGGITTTSTINLTIAAIAVRLTLSVSVNAVQIGDPFTVTGSISPVQAGAAINIVYTRPDGTGFTRTVHTASDGTFSDNYTLGTVDPVGSWNVQAQYVGGGAYSGSTSQVYSFQVVAKSFLATFGMPIGSYALWIVLLIIIVIVLALPAIMYLRRRPPTIVIETSAPPSSLPPQGALPETKVCPSCGHVNPAGSRFCDRCSAAMEQ